MISHSELVTNLKKSGEDILSSLTPEKADMLHMAIGICGEAGELLDAVKKHVIYNKSLDIVNVIEELGDLEFYMEGLRQSVHLNRVDILTVNKSKLEQRYSSGSYSDKQAQERADKC